MNSRRTPQNPMFLSVPLALALVFGRSGAAAAQPGGPEITSPDAPAPKAPSGRSLTDVEVITIALRSNSDLTAASLSEKQSAYAVQAEEERYPFLLQANAGYTHSSVPSLASGGSIITGGKNTIVVGSELRKDFATGTLLSLSVQGQGTATSRSDTSSTSGSGDTDYTFSTRFAATQPLLRGAWTKIGEAGLRSARIEQTAAREGRERVTSEVVRDTMLAYWELWYAGRALVIERAARDLSLAQRDEARSRRTEGALSPVDVLSFETRVASLDEGITSAELTELSRTLDLAQVLGVEAPSSAWQAASSPPEDAPTPSVHDVEAKLARRSPELQELEARVNLAKERAEIAGDAYRPRLDVEAYLEVRGSATGSASAALGQLGSTSALGGYVGVFFETPLTGKRETADVESARVAIKSAENQLAAAKSRLNITASRLVAQVAAAKARRAAAEQTVGIAAKQLEAERSRFSLGGSTPLQVQAAEDSLRQARLRVERAKVDQAQSILALEHASGDLAARYAASPPK